MQGENNTRRGQLRGYIFEVVIRQLLKKNGWDLLNKNENGRIKVSSDFKIEIKGRGTWHQIDSPCIFLRRIPFIFPIRLLVEAKFYNQEIQKDKIRSFIGVIKDISENYFIDNIHTINSQNRYTDLGAFFSASGFQEETVNLAFVHGIKTISYRTNPEFKEIEDSIKLLEKDGLYCSKTIVAGQQLSFMKDLEEILADITGINAFLEKYNGNDKAKQHIKKLHELLHELQSNFFGLTSTGVLLHFLSNEKFPSELFENTDEQPCKVHYGNPTNRGIPMWLVLTEDRRRRRFYFDVPPGLEEVIRRGGDIISAKQHHFEKLSVSYIINGLLRSLTLKIDKEWIDRLRNRKVG
jgi:hypothetical protein